MYRHRVGALYRLELLGDGAVVGFAVVAHLYCRHYITGECRGTGADDTLADVHGGIAAAAHDGGLVVLTVDDHTALAAVVALLGERGVTGIGTPVGTCVYRVVDVEVFAVPHGIHQAAVHAGLEPAVGRHAVGDGVAVGAACVEGRGTHVDVGRAVDVTQISAAVEESVDRTARDVHNRRGAFGGLVKHFGACLMVGTLGLVSVVHELRAAVEALEDVAAVHVDVLQTVDDRCLRCILVVTAAAGEDVLQYLAAVHVEDDIAVLCGVFVSCEPGERGVGHLDAGFRLAFTRHKVIAAVDVALVAEHRTHSAAAVDAAVHQAVVYVQLHILVVGACDELVAGIYTGIVCACGVGTVAGAVDVLELARVDVDDASVHVTGEVVAAVEVVHEVDALEVEVRRAADVTAPAAAIELEEWLVPSLVGLDEGLGHIAALAAAVGLGVGDLRGVVEVQVRGFRDVAAVLVVEVLPVALAAGVYRTRDDGRVGTAQPVVDDDAGGAAVGHRAAAVDCRVDVAAPDVDVRRVDVGFAGYRYHAARRVGRVAGRRGAVGVYLVQVVTDGYEVIASVRTAPDVVHRAAAHVDTRVAADKAADIVAAIQVVDAVVMGLGHVDIRHARHVTHAAAAEDGIGDIYVFAVHLHIGRHTLHVFVVGVLEGLVPSHTACVGAAVDVLGATIRQTYLRHAGSHLVVVVAAEDGAHKYLLAGLRQGVVADGPVVHALLVGAPFAAVVRSVDIVYLRVVEQHNHLVLHTGTVAAAVDGVYVAATGVDVEECRLLVREVAEVGGAYRDIVVNALGLAGVVPLAVARAVEGVYAHRVLHPDIHRVVGLPLVLHRIVFVQLLVQRVDIVRAVGVELLHAVSMRDGAAIVYRAAMVATEGGYLARHVVTGEHGVDVGVAIDVHVGDTVNGGHEAATEHLALYLAAADGGVHLAHLHAVGGTQYRGVLPGLALVLDVAVAGEAHRGVDTGTVDVTHDEAALDVHVGVVVGRYELAHMLVVGVVGHVGIGVVEVFLVVVTRLLGVVAVQVTIRAAIDVAEYHHVTVAHHIGALGSALANGAAVAVGNVHAAVVACHRASHIAADVVATVDVAESTACDIDAARILHVGLAAAAVHIFTDDIGGVQCRHYGTNHARHGAVPA